MGLCGPKHRIEKPYQYDVLADDEIRTLVIHPGEEKENLKGSIERHKLNDTKKQYTALSYVWGSTEQDSELWIEEHCIPITRSAEILLRRVRDAREPMRVWLDAICINQEEQEERSHQVSLMNSIFAGAARVLIWVGDSDEHTASLFQIFKRWEEHQDTARSRKSASAKKSRRNSKTQSAGRSRRSDSCMYLDQGSLEKVTEFVKRPWFQRAWTFQEACLSDKSEILCGNHRLPWRTFIMAALYIKDQRRLDAFGTTADTIMALAHFSAANAEKETPFLSVLLPLTRGLKSLDPRDKIFCLLGMVEKRGLGDFKPDYTMDMAEVYTVCARAMMSQERGLSVLSGTQLASKNATLPSWVPDWTQARATAYIHGFEWPRGPLAHQINRNAPFDNDVGSAGRLWTERHLSVQGAQIDIVKFVVKPTRLLELVRMVPETPEKHPWRESFDQSVEEIRRVICRRDYTEKLLRTLCANKAKLTGSTEETSPRMEPMSLWVPGKLIFEADAEGLRSAIAYLSTFLPNRAVFRTRKGLIGIGPDYMAKGDEVWNIVGGDVPFVLRRKWHAGLFRAHGKQGHPQFTLVGECYVDGIMDGELWTWPHECVVPGYELDFKNIEIV